MEAQIEQQLDKILPEDLARTFESAYHVFQGNHEHMDELLKHGGVLLRKAAQRFSPTQMIVGIAALAAVAVVLVNRASEGDHEGEAHDVSARDSKRQLGGENQSKDQNKGGQSNGNK
ncbi:MAG: hypothetical protein JWR44_3233 [Hymenobacter sp.]|jgi:hypothetical protein|nr:hypothetical protein [Hymenobacter sp.]